MIPIIEEFSNKTNAEIKKEIKGVKQINVNYYPIIAKRAQEDVFFEEFLLNELTSKENLEEKFFGFIKIAWIPLIAIIENSQNELISKAVAAFKKWPHDEKENFLNYIKKEMQISRHFE